MKKLTVLLAVLSIAVSSLIYVPVEKKANANQSVQIQLAENEEDLDPVLA